MFERYFRIIFYVLFHNKINWGKKENNLQYNIMKLAARRI